MALRILGIDLGTSSVKVSELQSSFRTLELVSLRRAPVVTEDPRRAPTLAEQLTALSSLIHVGAHADVVVVALPGAGAATHRLSFPFSDLRRLEQTLGFEVEGQIPFDLADVRYDYEVLSQQSHRGGAAARTEVLVGVVRRDIVSGLLEGLAALKLDPRVLTLPGLALQQLPLPPLGADVILDLGHTRVGFLARENGRPSFVRGFDGGGQVLTLALAKARGLDWAQAEALKEQSSLVGGDPEVQAVLTRALMPMVREVRQTLKQVAGLARNPIERVWLTGGTSRLAGLSELLTRELGVACEPLPDLTLPGLTPTHEELQLGSLAVALAMRGHTGNRTSRFNLRRGDQTFFKATSARCASGPCACWPWPRLSSCFTESGPMPRWRCSGSASGRSTTPSAPPPSKPSASASRTRSWRTRSWPRRAATPKAPSRISRRSCSWPRPRAG